MTGDVQHSDSCTGDFSVLTTTHTVSVTMTGSKLTTTSTTKQTRKNADGTTTVFTDKSTLATANGSVTVGAGAANAITGVIYHDTWTTKTR